MNKVKRKIRELADEWDKDHGNWDHSVRYDFEVGAEAGFYAAIELLKEKSPTLEATYGLGDWLERQWEKKDDR